MRDILFRVWDKEEGVMNYEPFEYGNDADIHGSSSQILLNNFFKKDWLIFMQYTNLKDRGGKKIYEGDIIKMYDLGWVGKVIYKTDIQFSDNTNLTGWWFQCKEAKDGSFPLRTDSNYYVGNVLKVVGNMWENPELLKEDLNQ